MEHVVTSRGKPCERRKLDLSWGSRHISLRRDIWEESLSNHHLGGYSSSETSSTIILLLKSAFHCLLLGCLHVGTVIHLEWLGYMGCGILWDVGSYDTIPNCTQSTSKRYRRAMVKGILFLWLHPPPHFPYKICLEQSGCSKHSGIKLNEKMIFCLDGWSSRVNPELHNVLSDSYRHGVL